MENKFSEKTYITSRIITCLIALILTIIYSLIKQFKIYQLLCIIFYMIFKLSEALVDVIHGSLQKKWRFDIIGLSFFIRLQEKLCGLFSCLLQVSYCYFAILIFYN